MNYPHAQTQSQWFTLTSTDRWGQSKITTGPAIANVIDDFTLTPEFDPGIQR